MTGKEAMIRGYAEALFAVAEAEGETQAVESQLFAFAKLLETQPRVREALIDPALPAENKKALIRDTLGERANPIAVNLLGFLAEHTNLARIDHVHPVAGVALPEHDLAEPVVPDLGAVADHGQLRIAEHRETTARPQERLELVNVHDRPPPK